MCSLSFPCFAGERGSGSQPRRRLEAASGERLPVDADEALDHPVLAEVAPRVLGIVSLISFLIGLILGFVGAVQLQQFGASIFVANLVAIAMTLSA